MELTGDGSEWLDSPRMSKIPKVAAIWKKKVLPILEANPIVSWHISFSYQDPGQLRFKAIEGE